MSKRSQNCPPYMATILPLPTISSIMMKIIEPFILSHLQGVVISSEFPRNDPADSLEQ